MPTFPMRFPAYSIPAFTPEQNAAYARNLWELEQPNAYVRMIPASTQAISTAGANAVVWAGESTIWQRQGMTTLATGTTYVEIPFDAMWHIDALSAWDASTAGDRRIAVLVKVSGTGTTGEITSDFRAPVVNTRVPMSATVPLFKGDRLSLQVTQTAGVVVGIEGGENRTFISLTAIGGKA